MPARWHCSASRCLNGCKRIIYRLSYKTRGYQTKLSGSLFEAFVYYSYSALLPVRVAGNLYKSGCKHRDKIVETGESKQPSTLKTIKPKLMGRIFVRVRPNQSGLYLAFNEPLMGFNGGEAPTGRGVPGHFCAAKVQLFF